jgi:hypothetical protein
MFTFLNPKRTYKNFRHKKIVTDLLRALSYGARKSPLLGKHIPQLTQSAIEFRLLSN